MTAQLIPMHRLRNAGLAVRRRTSNLHYRELANMMRYGLVCLLCGTISWGQAVTPSTAPGIPSNAAETAASNLGDHSRASGISQDMPVITIAGLCANSSRDKATPTNCKTVITRGQFEEVIEAVQPDMRGRARREFAEHYVEALVMSRKAEELGLDKGLSYQEQIELARIQVLSQDLKRLIQEEASHISDRDIESYYRNNTARFERAEIDRIYVPRTQQLISVSGGPDIYADKNATLQESEVKMREEADRLRILAVAGKDFSVLQAYAYEVAGIKSVPPSTSMVIRRISLPPDQSSVMDLKPGEISSVFADPNGYFIYRIKNKNLVPLNKVREEVAATVRSQRREEKMRAIYDSGNATLDENYFAGRALPQSNVASDHPPTR